ncbi:hypothetical protein BDW71DRAFT_197882 [Aspergillus fruticulosus]
MTMLHLLPVFAHLGMLHIRLTTPRWTLEVTPGTLSSAEKETLAKAITDNYVQLDIPAFLVNVFFHENRIGTFYSAGKTPQRPPIPVNRIVGPILAPKGVKWEYNIYEHPADIWRANGMIPPVQQEEIWEQWMDLNEPVKYGEYLAKQEK